MEGDADISRSDFDSSRNRAAPLVDRTPLPLIEVKGPSHTVSYVNASFCGVVGKMPHDLVGHPFAEIVPGGNECVSTLDAVYATGKAVVLPAEIDRDLDSSHWLFAMWPALDVNARAV